MSSTLPWFALVGAATVVACSSGEEGAAVGEDDITRGRPPPIEEKAAGFDFAGFRVASVDDFEVCPEIVDPVGEACIRVGGRTSAVRGCESLCSLPVAERGKVAGFDFQGFRIAKEQPADEFCPEIVDAVSQVCFSFGGAATATEGCAALCSVPVAERGKVAGYDLQGPKILPEPELGVACPEIVRPEEIACSEAGGRVIEASGCRALCSTPIVNTLF